MITSIFTLRLRRIILLFKQEVLIDHLFSQLTNFYLAGNVLGFKGYRVSVITAQLCHK